MKKYSFVLSVVLGCFLGTLVSQLLIIPQVVVGATPAKPEICRATKFELIDSNGRKRASLEIEDEDNVTALYLWDSSEKTCVALKASPSSGSMLMKIEDKPVLGFAVDKNNQGSMGFMNDITGKPGITMSAIKGGGGILIHDEDGRPRQVQTAK